MSERRPASERELLIAAISRLRDEGVGPSDTARQLHVTKNLVIGIL